MKLGEQFPTEVKGGKIKLSSESDKGTTGNFEVEVNGQLIHSKKAGDGFLAENAGSLEKVIGKIKCSL
jgi:selT/selW/selH-like putative selenoprotein